MDGSPPYRAVGALPTLPDFSTVKRQVLDRVSILDVVSPHVRLRRTGRRWIGLCPFHNEKTPSFSVSPDLGIFKCFGCGRGGDVFTFVQTRENLPFMEALTALADLAGVEMEAPSGPSSSAGPTRHDLAKVNAWAVGAFTAALQGESGRAAREYLLGRGLSLETVSRFSLGLALGEPSIRAAAAKQSIPMEVLLAADLIRSADGGRTYDTFRQRLMFPIRDVSGRVLGFGGRTLVDDPAKYLNTRQNALFDKGAGLYGLDLARDSITQRRRAVVVEGYTDCMAAHQAGFTETVATLGTALTGTQVDLLRRYGDSVVLLFDSDSAGEAAADRAIRLAVPKCVEVRLARVPDGKDPCEFLAHAPAAAFGEALDRATPALDFAWQRTLVRYEADRSPARRRDAVDDFLGLVREAVGAGAIDAIQTGMLAGELGRLVGIDQTAALAALKPARPRRAPGGSESGSASNGSPSPTGAQPGPLAPPDEFHAAWAHLLGAVMNEPGLLGGESLAVEAACISDPRDRRIAEVVLHLSDTLGDYHLADVLAALDAPELVERAADLADQGGRRRNYETTFSLARNRIRRAHRLRMMEQSRRRLVDRAGSADEAAAREELARLQEGLREGHPFTPARFRVRAMLASDPASPDKGGTSASPVEKP